MNAIKFSSDKGKVVISVKCLNIVGVNQDVAVQICVKDYGIGISETDIQAIFDPFFKTSN